MLLDRNKAIAWRCSLDFTVERSSKSLIGSAVSGEGLVNVYRGTDNVLLAPVAMGIVYDKGHLGSNQMPFF